MAEQPAIGSRWGHVKRGGTYVVIDNGVIEATLTACVIYKADADGTTWVRPLSEFMDGRFLEIEAAQS